MPWMSIASMAIPVVSSLIGGKKGSSAANSAANAQVQSIDQASGIQSDALAKIQALQQGQYNTSNALLAPYRDIGSSALAKLQAGLNGGTYTTAGTPAQAASSPDAAAQKILSLFPSWSATGIPGQPGSSQDIVDSFLRHAPQLIAAGSGDSFGEVGYGPDLIGKIQQMLPEIQAAANAVTPARAATPGETITSPDLLRKFTGDDLNADPVYQSGLKFGLDQGTGAINARAIAGGGYDSGATLKALTRYGNDYGSTKAEGAYNRFTGDQNSVFNKLMGVAGIGQNATGQTVAAGTNAANANTAAQTTAASNLAELATGGGNARAAGIVGGSNAWGNAMQGVSGAFNNYQNNETLKKLIESRNNSNYSQLYGASYGAGGDRLFG